MKYSSFSVGISDLLASSKVNNEIKTIIESNKEKVKELYLNSNDSQEEDMEEVSNPLMGGF